MVTKFNDAARFAFEYNHHASSNLGCWNCHYFIKSFWFVIGVATDRSRRLNANDESSGTLV